MNENTFSPQRSSRRQFLKTSGSAVLGGALVANLGVPQSGFAANSDTLRIGLVGCGGRGSGAALDALYGDNNIILTALADAFEDRLKSSLANLKKDAKVGSRVKVDPDHCFVGLDAYQKLIDSGVDVVLLATPPGFRPLHLKAAVEAGKHIFCEKPMASDAPGVRSVMESSRLAKQKNLALVAGFCWRYDYARREFYKRVLDGAIGDVRAVHATYLTGPVKPMPASSTRPKDMGDLEWQMRNWYNFVWMCGDGLVEQACHSIDKIAWAKKDVPPLRAVGNGGRVVSNGEGNIFDHIDVFYEWADGTRATMAQRQIPSCHSDNSDYLVGATGTGTIKGWDAPVIRGASPWQYQGAKNNMYRTEHEELFASIRSGNPIFNGTWMAQSTLMAIMGRMSAYSGQEVTWDMALNSQERLVPEHPDWGMKLPIVPMAVPGQTQLV